MKPGSSPRRAGESGLVAGAEALVFGVLIFVLGTIIVVNAWSLIDAKFAASAAAREAVRAVVDAPIGSELPVLAREGAELAFAAHGRDPGNLDVLWQGAGPGPAQARCAQVHYRVVATVEVVLIPRWSTRTAFDVSAQHSELIDPYRSGLDSSECGP